MKLEKTGSNFWEWIYDLLTHRLARATREIVSETSRGLRKMFAKYYFNNPAHVTLPQSSRASCLGIVSLEAHSQFAAAALCLCLSPGYDGAHMVHPLAWPSQLPGSSASPQRAGRWSPWTPEKGRWAFFYSLTRRSRVQVLPTRARNNDTWDRRRIVNNMR